MLQPREATPEEKAEYERRLALYEKYGIPYLEWDGDHDEFSIVEQDYTKAHMLIWEGKDIPEDLAERLLFYKSQPSRHKSAVTKEHMPFREMILADLKIAQDYKNSDNRYERIMEAFHMQQAIEKTIILKARLHGKEFSGHNIGKLIRKCEREKINIRVPKEIVKKANTYSNWYGYRDNPEADVRKESLDKSYSECLLWLNSGDTYVSNGETEENRVQQHP